MTNGLREDKPPWSAVPASVKKSVERTLGTQVLRGVRLYGGYGPSATFVLSLADGRRVFFKGIYPLPEGSPVSWSLAAERRVYEELGRWVQPWAPASLGWIESDGWEALILAFVDGERVPPWSAAQAERAARSYAAFHASTLDADLPRWLHSSQHREFAGFWRQIGKDPAAVQGLATLAVGRDRQAADWLAAAVPRLAQAERALARAKPPFALLHFDTRSDNVRLAGDLLQIFDWPSACVGPAEFDLAAFAQSIESEGGPPAEAFVEAYASVLPVRQQVLRGAIVGIAGYFADRAPRPEVPELPRLRWVQKRQLRASLGWAARSLGLPPPKWLADIP